MPRLPLLPLPPPEAPRETRAASPSPHLLLQRSLTTSRAGTVVAVVLEGVAEAAGKAGAEVAVAVGTREAAVAAENALAPNARASTTAAESEGEQDMYFSKCSFMKEKQRGYNSSSTRILQVVARLCLVNFAGRCRAVGLFGTIQLSLRYGDD